MKIQIIQIGNNKRNNRLADIIAEELKDLDGEITIEYIPDNTIHTFAEKPNKEKENISKKDSVYELITHIYRAGKSKEYQSIVRNEFPNGLDFDKFIGYLYTHKEEILKACGLQ